MIENHSIEAALLIDEDGYFLLQGSRESPYTLFLAGLMVLQKEQKEVFSSLVQFSKDHKEHILSYLDRIQAKLS